MNIFLSDTIEGLRKQQQQTKAKIAAEKDSFFRYGLIKQLEEIEEKLQQIISSIRKQPD